MGFGDIDEGGLDLVLSSVAVMRSIRTLFLVYCKQRKQRCPPTVRRVGRSYVPCRFVTLHLYYARGGG